MKMATSLEELEKWGPGSITYEQGDIAFRSGTPEQRVKEVNFDVCKKAPKLIGYQGNVPRANAKQMFVSANAENLVKIGPLPLRYLVRYVAFAV